MGKCSSKDKFEGKDQEQDLVYSKVPRTQSLPYKVDGRETKESSSFSMKGKSQIEGKEEYTFEQLSQLYDNKKQNSKSNIEQFEKLKILGRGGFGKVYLVKSTEKDKVYAMKSVAKEIIEEGYEKYQIQEVFIMSKLKHPFIVKLYNSIQSSEELHLILEFCQGGELVEFLKKNKFHSEEVTIFYVAQLILLFEKLHNRKIIYRDLKPQNILLHSDGFLRLTDFGICKLLVEKKQTYTKCGTRLYIPPEVLEGEGYDCTSDYFNLGQISYEILTGNQIYHQFSEIQRMKKIKEQAELEFPEYCSEEMKDFISRLIKHNPKERLGVNGIKEIKEHELFRNFSWDSLYCKSMIPPITLEFDDDQDTRYFNPKYTKQPIQKQKEQLCQMDHYNRYTYNRMSQSNQSMNQSSGANNRNRVDTNEFIKQSMHLENQSYTKPIEEIGLQIVKENNNQKSNEDIQ